ncbi:MAG: hypothetical protein EP329_01190, partial [Deltaproteobacteria bacterium]
MTNHAPPAGPHAATRHARRAALALALAVLTGLGACAHATTPARIAEDDPALDAEVFTALSPGDRLALAGQRVVALRSTLARVSSRIDTLRDAVRTRDALADWGQLVCLEERLPDVRGFVQRGERAWDALREALRTGDDVGVWTR